MLVEKFQRLFPVKVGLLKGNCFFLLFLRRKKERQLPLSFPWKEEAALRALVQTSPTRARGLWSGVFFSIEVNPSTELSGAVVCGRQRAREYGTHSGFELRDGRKLRLRRRLHTRGLIG